jgi:predicted phage tail protein
VEYNTLIVGQGGGGGKEGGGGGRVAVEDPDSLQSLEIARVVDLLSEGEIEGLASGYQSIIYDGTPLQNQDGSFNFSNVTIEVRTGTQNQASLENVTGIESEKAVNVEITAINPAEQTITDPNVDSVYITIGIPQLTFQDMSTGDLHGSTVSLEVDVSSAGGPFIPVPTGFTTSSSAGIGIGTQSTLRDAGSSTSTTSATSGYVGMGGNTSYNSMGGFMSSSAYNGNSLSNFGTQTIQIPAIVGYSIWQETVNANQSTITFGVRSTFASNETAITTSIALRYRKIGTTTWTLHEVYTSQLLRTYVYNIANTGGTQSKFKTYTATIKHSLDKYEYEVVDYTNRATTKVGITKVVSDVEKYDITISGKTISKYQRGVPINLPGDAPWIVRIRRTTPDSTSSALSNKTWWDTFTEIANVRLNYPNSALIFTGIDAKQFSRIPTRAFEIEGIKCKVPSNYNSRTREYTGFWDGTFIVAWTDNPAWIFYDIITNTRYGLGDLIPEALVDKWELYSVGQYCDEIVFDGYGQPEPRFTCNLYLQTREDAYKVIGNMASIFRAMAFWSGGSVSVSQDRPADISYIFNSANIIDGEFTYSGTSSKVRHNAVLVSWNNPKNMYKLEVEYVEDAEDIAINGLKQTDVVAMGCTSRTQAHRLGKWLLYTERYENEIVTFKTGLDGLVVGLGSIIQTQDQFRAGLRMGGRINFASTTSLDVDSDVVIESGKTYEITFILPNPSSELLPNNTSVLTNKGELVSRILTNSPGTTRHLTWASAVSEPAQPNSMWVLAVNDLSLQSWRITSIKEINTTQAEITALKYNADKYAVVEEGILPEESVISAIDSIPDSVANFTYQEYPAYISQDTLANKVQLNWGALQNVTKYSVTYRDLTRNTNPVEIIVTNATTLEIFPVDLGTYLVQVAGVSPLGKLGIKSTLTMNIVGKIAPPSNVSNFTYTAEPAQLVLTWDAIPDADLLEYEIRLGNTWASGIPIQTGSKSTSKTYNAQTYGTYNFWIAAKDTSRNYSSIPTLLSIDITVPLAPSLNLSIVNTDYLLEWSIPYSVFQIDYFIIKRGISLPSSIEIARPKTNTFNRIVDYIGSMNYYVAAVDITGNIGSFANINHTILAPKQSSLSNQVIDNNVLIYWTDAKTTLPISTYEIRKGTVYSSAEIVGTKSGRFTSLAEIIGGSFVYWVTAIDTAGNYGTPAYISTIVSQPRDYTVVTSYISTFSGTKVNTVIDNSSLMLPVNTTETFAQHFTARGWSTPNDQINAGYPIFIEPTLNTGYYEEEFDLGGIVTNARVTFSLTSEVIVGTPVLDTVVSIKYNAGDAWIDYPGVLTVYGSAYRYVKIKATVNGSTSKDLLKISSIRLNVDIRVISDSGSVVCNASDVGGTTVLFNIPFVDISSIVVSPIGTTPITAIYDFTDIPNPTSFKVLLFNSAGTRVSGTASWSVRGY